ncbi:hypothetical protein B0H11DRAFT_2090265 [Mycena galericulata]|nr:hypothetical protein B0H11DRAFT_2090265 [Mycena galericulata]
MSHNQVNKPFMAQVSCTAGGALRRAGYVTPQVLLRFSNRHRSQGVGSMLPDFCSGSDTQFPTVESSSTGSNLVGHPTSYWRVLIGCQHSGPRRLKSAMEGMFSSQDVRKYPMSASSRKDRFYLLGIHQAPPHVSKKEFKTSIEVLVAGWDALLIVKNTGLKSGTIFSNDLLDAHARATGMPEPRPTAILTIESESSDHIVAALRDAEATKFISAADAFKAERGACLFSAQATTKIDNPSTKDRILGSVILKVPQDLSTHEYERKLNAISDRFLALPVAQKCVLKFTVWSQDDVSMVDHTQAMGVPAPERTLVAQLEYENVDRMMEVLSGDYSACCVNLSVFQISQDVGVQKFLAEGIQDLNLAEGSNSMQLFRSYNLFARLTATVISG